jgi:hypothetical protein
MEQEAVKAANQTVIMRLLENIEENNNRLEKIHSRVKSRIDNTMGNEDLPTSGEQKEAIPSSNAHVYKMDMLFNEQRNFLSEIEYQLDRLDQIL